MFIKQSELFRNLGHDFVKEVMENSEKESMASGYVLFFEGQAATHFYTLIKGSVRLMAGETGRSVFMLNHTGESFGWSSLVGRDTYSATAETMTPASVVKIDRDAFERTCKKYPEDGMLFMKHLAALLGRRLLRGYDMVEASLGSDEYRVYGTGQVQEMAIEE